MEKNLYNRRLFLSSAVKAGAVTVLVNPATGHFILDQTMTVSEVIDRIIAELPGGPLNDTVDTIKSGSGNTPVTGIITTMFATVAVIKTAIKMKANFIIAHEPSFYNHLDNVNWIENNTIVKEKQELLEKNQIIIWRFHDYWHRMKPDGILHGILWKTGWLSYNPKEEHVFQIPAQPLNEIIRFLKDSLRIPHLRYIGDPSAACSIIALMPGAAGGQRQIQTMISAKADLVIVGESNEWETPEYIRDSRALGRSVSMIVLGHDYSEEPGMEWLVQWLHPKLPGIRINHVPSGEPFTWG
jgi:putative NIF3 family GTP cyclohydrolase 1 type 2